MTKYNNEVIKLLPESFVDISNYDGFFQAVV